MPNVEEVNQNSGGGDAPDAKSLFLFSFGKSAVPTGVLSTHVDSDVYNMNHPNRGICLIFNNRVFDTHTDLPERRGTDVDTENLYLRFRELDFDVTVHHNLTAKQILRTLEQAGQRDFSKDDCFVCCVLTHGDEGILFGRDGKFDKELLFAPFKGDVCPSLAGKPKLFFIQACQGDKLDEGVVMLQSGRLDQSVDATDAAKSLKLPVHADFLIAYSTVPGFYSWRNTTLGSWFIQGLCSVLEKHGTTSDLLSMMTVVNRFVAFGFESCVPQNRDMDEKKQIPYITHTLTRKVFFPRN